MGLEQEEGTYIRIMVKEQYEIWKEGTWALYGGKVPNKA